jgi:hypothetical protein
VRWWEPPTDAHRSAPRQATPQPQQHAQITRQNGAGVEPSEGSIEYGAAHLPSLTHGLVHGVPMTRPAAGGAATVGSECTHAAKRLQ